MINTPTTLILGAGASYPFGFPLGTGLVRQISDSLEFTPALKGTSGSGLFTMTPVYSEDETDNKFIHFLNELGFERSEIEKFRNDLINSQLNSIDAFLEFRTEHLSLGKLCIAWNIYKSEKSKTLFSSGGNWYRIVWNSIVTTQEKFKGNKLKIVTFNYDRSLEYYLSHAYGATYNCSLKEAYSILLDTLEFVHLHGSLGRLIFQDKNSVVMPEEGYFPYDGEIDFKEDLLNIADSLKIIHEIGDLGSPFHQAKECFLDSDRIAFLGFGYNQTNLDRLELNKFDNKYISGSGFGLSYYQVKNLIKNNSYINDIEVSQGSCDQFLEKVFILN